MSQTHSHPQAVSLNDLVLSPLNVRKTPPGAAEQEELKASLSAHGLLENLVVRAADDGRFGVLAGGRRLAALQALAAEGHIPADYPVARSPAREIERQRGVTLTREIEPENAPSSGKLEPISLDKFQTLIFVIRWSRPDQRRMG